MIVPGSMDSPDGLQPGCSDIAGDTLRDHPVPFGDLAIRSYHIDLDIFHVVIGRRDL